MPVPLSFRLNRCVIGRLVRNACTDKVDDYSLVTISGTAKQKAIQSRPELENQGLIIRRRTDRFVISSQQFKSDNDRVGSALPVNTSN